MKAGRKQIRKHNRVISTLVIVSMLFLLPMQVEATSSSQKKQNAQSGLDTTNKKIESLKEEAAAIGAELDEKGQELADIMSAQASLETEIEATEAAIAQTELDLQAAKEKAEEQYESMKLRIQFMYESSTSDSYWSAILGAQGIADLLNRVEYVKQVESADRDMLDAYEATVAEIEEIKVSLEEQHTQLTGMKAVYDEQQKQVEAMVAQLKKSASNYATQIANAQKQAENYKKQIKEAERQMAAEEEARRKAAEAAKNEGTNGGSAGINPAQSTNVSGQEVVNYAMKFVGGPYVWAAGHYSTLSARQNYNIMNGVDCSGFVSCVFAHFGIMTPNYSISFAYGGKEVSPDCMQPGDVIVYGYKGGIGHVAIYMGNGKIVEAQSTNAGITANRSWNNREVIAIRRYI